MKTPLACFALPILAFCSANALLAQNSSVEYRPSAQEMRLWTLIERDRPRNMLHGARYDSKDSKRLTKEVQKQSKLLAPAAAEYRRTRSAAARRKLIDIVNRGGLLWYDLDSMRVLRTAFFTLHEAGPVLNDPEDAGNPQQAEKRHRALLRLWAFDLWKNEWTGTADKRILATYVADCERRPSNDRPSGNNHDPSCGFMFELKLPPDWSPNKSWDANRIPQSLADFAAGIPTQRPHPDLEGYFTYPLVPTNPGNPSAELWAGNRSLFAKQYAREYFLSKAYHDRRAAESAAFQAQEAKRQSEYWAATRALQDKLRPRWDELWNKPRLSASEQLELENISETLYRMPEYLSRFNLVSYDRLDRFCRLGHAYECDRKDAIDQAAREQRRRAEGDWGGVSGGQTVTVRVYDQNGNYKGSTQTTKVDAELMGAR